MVRMKCNHMDCIFLPKQFPDRVEFIVAGKLLSVGDLKSICGIAYMEPWAACCW